MKGPATGGEDRTDVSAASLPLVAGDGKPEGWRLKRGAAVPVSAAWTGEFWRRRVTSYSVLTAGRLSPFGMTSGRRRNPRIPGRIAAI